jgi:GR25 family glycosyltransferase involved in LPS biosynthesis
MRNIVICSDSGRRAKIEREFASAGMNPEFMEGVFVNSGERVLGHVVYKPGNVGCMLAKLKAWELAGSGSEPCNIFEDDEVIPADYLKIRDQVISEAHGYEFIFLNVLRPTGDPHSKNLLKLSPILPNREPTRNFTCNVWNSNYVITPQFGNELSSLLRSHKRLRDVFAGSTSDWIISDILHENSATKNIYAVRSSNLISMHDERESIRRSRN